MEFLVYLFAAAFCFMAAALFVTFHKTRHTGLLLLGVTYGVSAVLAILLMHWWPILAGFAMAWLLKLGGLDPGERVGRGEQ